jgi:hypothetical protein
MDRTNSNTCQLPTDSPSKIVRIGLNEPPSRCKTMSNATSRLNKFSDAPTYCSSSATCNAVISRSGMQCGKAVIPTRYKCAQHGGLSTGPKTPEGRQRCAEVRTVHGRETITMRMERSLASARLAVLESVGFGLGLMTGTRMPGRRPDRMAEVYPELQALFRKLVTERAKHGS